MKDSGIKCGPLQTSSCSNIAVRLDHFVVVIGCSGEHFIRDHMPWTYNIYTEEWRKYLIPKENLVSINLVGACGVVIEKEIYVLNFVGNDNLWQLTRNTNGCFAWNTVSVKDVTKTPFPRKYFTGWEYAGKLWIFGGLVPGYNGSTTGYLSDDNGDFYDSCTNQLLQFDIVTKEWTSMKCIGDVPVPRYSYATTIFEERVWLFGGSDYMGNGTSFNEVYQLDMRTLTWIQLQTGHPKPQGCIISCSLNVTTNSHLVLHGGHKRGITHGSGGMLGDTWILDLSTQTWRMYRSAKEDIRCLHSGASGISNDIIIIGGIKEIMCSRSKAKDIFHVMLEPKGLQQLAMKIVYKNRRELPWKKCFPKKLINLMAIADEHEDATTGCQTKCTIA